MERHSETMKSPVRRPLLGLVRLLLAIAICQACCGCTVFTYGSHILLTDPLHFPNNVNHLTTRHRYRKVAKQYLNDLYFENPDLPVSKEYSDGFMDGFTDYVTYGARSAPPALPPRRYWKKEYSTIEGFSAIQDWHAGFADGSLEAARSGLRELQMVPSSIVVSSMETPIGSETLPATSPEPLDTINVPADSVWPDPLPPEEIVPPVQFFLESPDEQASQQAQPPPEAAGAVQPAIGSSPLALASSFNASQGRAWNFTHVGEQLSTPSTPHQQP